MMTHIQYYEGFPDTPQNRAAITELVELISVPVKRSSNTRLDLGRAPVR